MHQSIEHDLKPIDSKYVIYLYLFIMIIGLCSSITLGVSSDNCCECINILVTPEDWIFTLIIGNLFVGSGCMFLLSFSKYSICYLIKCFYLLSYLGLWIVWNVIGIRLFFMELTNCAFKQGDSYAIIIAINIIVFVIFIIYGCYFILCKNGIYRVKISISHRN